jgi:hypothetical protein
MTCFTSTEDDSLMSDKMLSVFVNIYPPFAGAVGAAYKTREMADQMAARARIACVEVLYVPGEGLDDNR